MSCCGNRRSAFRAAPTSSVQGGAAQYRPSAPVEFEYMGFGQLTVTGPQTGVVYRFNGHGHRIQVRGADAGSLLAVPSLRAIRP